MAAIPANAFNSPYAVSPKHLSYAARPGATGPGTSPCPWAAAARLEVAAGRGDSPAVPAEPAEPLAAGRESPEAQATGRGRGCCRSRPAVGHPRGGWWGRLSQLSRGTLQRGHQGWGWSGRAQRGVPDEGSHRNDPRGGDSLSPLCGAVTVRCRHRAQWLPSCHGKRCCHPPGHTVRHPQHSPRMRQPLVSLAACPLCTVSVCPSCGQSGPTDP